MRGCETVWSTLAREGVVPEQLRHAAYHQLPILSRGCRVYFSNRACFSDLRTLFSLRHLPSILNFHQRSGSPKRIRRPSSMTNRVEMSRDHMYTRGFGPFGKGYCVLSLRSTQRGVVAAFPAVYLVNTLPLRSKDDRPARRFRRTLLFSRSSTLPGEPGGVPSCLRLTL